MHLWTRVSRNDHMAARTCPWSCAEIGKGNNGGIRMSLLEYHLMQLEAKWLWLKINDEKNIAIGCYIPKKSNSVRKRKRSLTVIAFTSGIGPFGEDLLSTIPATERKFRKNEKKIAQWYFRELCRSLKNGILQEKRDENKPFGKWD
jgi:hypothetical protein